MSIDLLDNYTYEEPTQHVLFEEGEYPFTILEINEVEYSKGTGNPYIPIKLEFKDEGGRTTTVYENLVFTEKAKWKIDSFLKCVWPSAEEGKRIGWRDAAFLAWLKKLKGVAKLGVEPVQGKAYDRNKVLEFLPATAKAASKPAAAPAFVPPAVEEEEEDSIPF